MLQLDRECEKFIGGPTIPYSERVHVTIDQRGKIFLNQKAHKMMGRPIAVYLYFNRPKDMIILEPTQSVTGSSAFLLKDTPQNGSRVIYANPFCKHFRIRPEGTQRFVAPETDAAGRLYLKLSETVSVSVGPRARKKRSAATK